MVHRINFDDIRPYNDSEVNHYLKLLINDEKFQDILKFVFSSPSEIEKVKHALMQVHSVRDLQFGFMYKLIKELILDKSTDGLTYSGIENLDKNNSYLFISNHRDIILDSALMNYLIVLEGMNTTQIAIGNNLLIDDWIEYIVKLNRAFVVRRNLPVRELLMASKKLSEYVRREITIENNSIWIAQREGRTKDGFDKTQPALLKMLNLSNRHSLADGFRELQIVPLSISYEFEPCGISKVAELYKRQTEGFEKTQEDDMRSMGEGLVRPKGRVHFGFGKPISAQIDKLNPEDPVGDQIEKLGALIDEQIYANFKLFPNNYIAEDILNHSSANSGNYTREEYVKFVSMLEEAAKEISGDEKTIRNMYLQMYVNPLLNKRKIQSLPND